MDDWLLHRYDREFLPTPSARRATATVVSKGGNTFYFYPRPPRGGRPAEAAADVVAQRISTHALRDERRRGPGPQPLADPISTHALREEGDGDDLRDVFDQGGFLPTPSARRATISSASACCLTRDFYPRPPRGGRLYIKIGCPAGSRFLPTPSARRATVPFAPAPAGGPDFYPRPPRGGRRVSVLRGNGRKRISTHALREEGDKDAVTETTDALISTHALREEGDRRCRRARPAPRRFLPTPSARRATAEAQNYKKTLLISTHALREEGDGGRPPEQGGGDAISTHALREEGDGSFLSGAAKEVVFLPTPSARRATCPVPCPSTASGISTHALREEGDVGSACVSFLLSCISTHALREEGDPGGRRSPRRWKYFYPRPPRGGRPSPGPTRAPCENIFLPTPSARRATTATASNCWSTEISTHALREEGDGRTSTARWAKTNFYPRPPRGGRPDKV